jgi:hypothetical protein
MKTIKDHFKELGGVESSYLAKYWTVEAGCGAATGHKGGTVYFYSDDGYEYQARFSPSESDPSLYGWSLSCGPNWDAGFYQGSIQMPSVDEKKVALMLWTRLAELPASTVGKLKVLNLDEKSLWLKAPKQ